MTIETKMSGWRISDLPEIKMIPTLMGDMITYAHLDQLTNKDVIDWLLRCYNFCKLNPEYAEGHHFGAWVEPDDLIKCSIAENHPDLAQELKEHFGDNWMDYYLRFGH